MINPWNRRQFLVFNAIVVALHVPLLMLLYADSQHNTMLRDGGISIMTVGTCIPVLYVVLAFAVYWVWPNWSLTHSGLFEGLAVVSIILTLFVCLLEGLA